MKIAVFVVCILALVGFVPTAAAQDTFGYDTSASASLGIPNYLCDWRTTCPPNTKVIDNSGLVGCEWVPGSTTCSGSCTFCTGSGAPVWICVKGGTDKCAVPAQHTGGVNCGFQVQNLCVYSATIGFPTPCDCSTVGGTISTKKCVIQNCV